MPTSNGQQVEAVALVVNPASGGGGNDDLQLEITRMLREQGVWVAAFETHPHEGARPAVKAALRAGFEDIWVIGGDGTIQQALAPIVAAGAVLGPIPGGTSNRLVAVIGHTEDDPLEQARWMLHQPIHSIDVGVCNQELFTGRAGVGIEALAAKLTEDDKSGLGNLAYIFAGVRAAQRAEPHDATVVTDDTIVYEGRMLGAIVTNLPILVPFKLPGFDHSTPTDGRLHAIIIPERPDLSRLWQWLARRRNGAADDAALFRHTARRFRIDVEGEAELHLDGEMLGAVRTVALECRPAALRVRGLKFASGT